MARAPTDRLLHIISMRLGAAFVSLGGDSLRENGEALLLCSNATSSGSSGEVARDLRTYGSIRGSWLMLRSLPFSVVDSPWSHTIEKPSSPAACITI